MRPRHRHIFPLRTAGLQRRSPPRDPPGRIMEPRRATSARTAGELAPARPVRASATLGFQDVCRRTSHFEILQLSEQRLGRRNHRLELVAAFSGSVAREVTSLKELLYPGEGPLGDAARA